jgi:type I restriction enzyme S subunit
MLQNLTSLFLQNSVKSAVPGVDRNDIHPTMTAVPPIEEQCALADFLKRVNSNIDAAIAKICEQIAKFQEYRTALISAAVTGKIDLRESAGEGEVLS